MKIVIVVYLFPPKWIAGTEIATFNIARFLAKKGHEIHVITKLDECTSKTSIIDGFYVHRISIHQIKFISMILFWLKIFRTIGKIKPEIIHIQGIGQSFPGYLAKKRYKIPYIVYARGSDVYLPPKETKIISKLTLKNANSVISLSENMKVELKKIYDGDICVIPNGIDLDKFKVTKNTVFKEKYRYKKKILFVGRLASIKGIEYLIHAMRIIKDNYEEVLLLIVGEGESKSVLEDITKNLDLTESVIFVGRVPNEDIPAYMAESDIFVLPSLSEGMPNVILEAMASGLPIVATNVGGTPDIIRNDVNGYLVKPKNSNELAEKLLFLLNTPKMRNSFSKINRKTAEKYDWTNIIEKLEKIYESK